MMSYRSSALVSMIGTPLIYEGSGFTVLLITTVGVVLVSAFAGIAVIYVDKQHENYLQGGSPPEKFHLRSLTKLGILFWVVSLTACVLYFSVVPFISFSTEFIVNKWGYSDVNAGLCTGTHRYLLSSYRH